MKERRAIEKFQMEEIPSPFSINAGEYAGVARDRRWKIIGFVADDEPAGAGLKSLKRCFKAASGG